jgi:lipoprotein-releasing system permease protein
MVLGSAIAEQLGAGPGDEVLALSPERALAAIEGSDERTLPLPFLVVEGANSRRDGFWGHRVFLSLEALGDLFGEVGYVHGFAIHLRPGVDPNRFALHLNGEILLPPLRARSWQEMNGDLLSVLALERAARFFSMASSVAIAAFAMGSFLASHVVRRTREIGLLLAVGAGRGAIALSFLIQSGLIGFFGCFCGTLLGALLLCFRDGLLRLCMVLFGGERGVLSFYAFDRLPIALSGWELFKICAFALAVTLLSGLLPVLRVLRIDPSRALRHE